jgi:hypothetical protein
MMVEIRPWFLYNMSAWNSVLNVYDDAPMRVEGKHEIDPAYTKTDGHWQLIPRSALKGYYSQPSLN